MGRVRPFELAPPYSRLLGILCFISLFTPRTCPALRRQWPAWELARLSQSLAFLMCP